MQPLVFKQLLKIYLRGVLTVLRLNGVAREDGAVEHHTTDRG
jgi:hypothetical protein